MATKQSIQATQKAHDPPGESSVFSPPATAPAASETVTHSTLETNVEPPPIAAFDPQPFLQELATGRTTLVYGDKDSIFAQGDSADAVFHIRTGRVKLTVVSMSGKEAVIAILPDNCFFGEGCLTGQPLRMATATAEGPTTVMRVTKQAMVMLLHKEPVFAERFLTYLLSRNIRMEADLVDHLFNSSEKRLARLLLLMANFGQESKPIPLIAKVSQETLAEMIGTTRSRVSFFLNRFREMGFVDYNGGGMHIHSSLVSVVLHD
jgi:CRP-like cAMP-binding protein